MALKKKEVKPAENNVLDEEKYIDDLVSKVSAAQKIFATYSQEQVLSKGLIQNQSGQRPQKRCRRWHNFLVKILHELQPRRASFY